MKEKVDISLETILALTGKIGDLLNNSNVKPTIEVATTLLVMGVGILRENGNELPGVKEAVETIWEEHLPSFTAKEKVH